MGFLVDDEGTALMWRGLVLAKAMEQFLTDVRWGELDYLLIDMPPGTGDIQMALSRLLPRAEMLVVTTPALAAQKVAVRVADMARRSYLKVVGVVENMSTFICGHGESYALFGPGAAPPWPRTSVCRSWRRCLSSRAWPPVATRARPSCWRRPTAPPARPSPNWPGAWPRSSCRPCR